MQRALACALAGLFLGASPARAASLPEILAKVYETNPRIAAARARLAAADERVAQALGSGRPRLLAYSSAAASRLAGDRGPREILGFRQVLALEQKLYAGGETRALVSAAENAVLAERARLAAVEQDVLLETVATCAAVLRDRALFALARDNERSLERQLAATRDRYRFGEVTRTDVAQAETRLSRAIADRLAAEGALAATGADFLRLVGEPPPERLEPVGLPAALPSSLEEALEAVEVHPVVRAARFALAGAEDEIGVALAALLPKLTLRGETAFGRDPELLERRTNEIAVVATLTVPLYQGGGEHARVRETRKLALQRRYDLEDARRAVARDIAAAWHQLATARARAPAIASQIRAAELALEGVRTEALAGARSVIDVLDAEQELFAARVDEKKAVYEELVAAHALLAATGLLTVERLALPTTTYDPQAHYRKVRGKWFGLGTEETGGRP
ncbi:MAG: TolC family outer membrane protein [Geminicoccaceae bacterium]|nr:TolC family outer membrane protein [Geminicoccaceae bacterium]